MARVQLFDWRRRKSGFLDYHFDQGDGRTCWAASTVAAVEANVLIHHGRRMRLSVQEIVDWCRDFDGTGGGFAFLALEYMRENGVSTEYQYPYNGKANRLMRSLKQMLHPVVWVESFRHIPRHEISEGRLIRELQEGPIIVDFCVLDDFESFKGTRILTKGIVENVRRRKRENVPRRKRVVEPWEEDIFDFSDLFSSDSSDDSSDDDLDGHEALIIGYGTSIKNRVPYWIIRNTYGPEWGDRGYAKVHRKFTKSFVRAFVIDKTSFSPPTRQKGKGKHAGKRKRDKKKGKQVAGMGANRRKLSALHCVATSDQSHLKTVPVKLQNREKIELQLGAGDSDMEVRLLLRDASESCFITCYDLFLLKNNESVGNLEHCDVADISTREYRLEMVADLKRNVARMESALPPRLYGTELIGVHRDWNEEVQVCRDMPHEVHIERILRDGALKKITTEIVYAAINGAVGAIRRSIPPLNPSEPDYLHTYVHNNIFFCYAFDTDVEDFFRTHVCVTFAGDEQQDVNDLATYASANVSGLYIPATCIIEYRGHGLVAQTILPGSMGSNKRPLLYGSIDDGDTFYWDLVFYSKDLLRETEDREQGLAISHFLNCLFGLVTNKDNAPDCKFQKKGMMKTGASSGKNQSSYLSLTTYNLLTAIWGFAQPKYKYIVWTMRSRLQARKIPAVRNLCQKVGYPFTLSEALKSFTEALSIFEQVAGPINKEVANCCRHMAMILHYSGDIMGTIMHLRNEVIINERSLVLDHPDTAHSYCNLGQYYHDSGKTELGIRHMERCLMNMTKELVGDEHYRTAVCHHALEVLYNATEGYKLAVKNEEATKAILVKLYGEDHPKTLDSGNWRFILSSRRDEAEDKKAKKQSAQEGPHHKPPGMPTILEEDTKE